MTATACFGSLFWNKLEEKIKFAFTQKSYQQLQALRSYLYSRNTQEFQEGWNRRDDRAHFAPVWEKSHNDISQIGLKIEAENTGHYLGNSDRHG